LRSRICRVRAADEAGAAPARLTIKGHRRLSLNHERYLDRRDPDALVEPKITLGESPLTGRRWPTLSGGLKSPETPNRSIGMAGNRTSSARFGSVFMTMQKTGDLRLQSGGVAGRARRSVLEESTLNLGGQTIPLAD
jgi:hypothetical protein